MLNLKHKKLELNKTALLLVREIYQITKSFQAEEKYSLTSQIRRAAISVPSNIAEGAARFSSKEKVRFFEISRSSIVELDTQLEIALILEYINNYDIKNVEINLESVFKMTCKLIGNLSKANETK